MRYLRAEDAGQDGNGWHLRDPCREKRYRERDNVDYLIRKEVEKAEHV